MKAAIAWFQREYFRPNPWIASIFGVVVFVALWYISRSPVVASAVVANILLHELGHVWYFGRWQDAKVKGVTFVPYMLGAVTLFECRHENRYRYEGPATMAGLLVGSATVIPLTAAYTFTGQTLYAVIALWICGIHLLNLLPFGGTDGLKVLLAVFRLDNIIVPLMVMWLAMVVLMYAFWSMGTLLLFVLVGVECLRTAQRRENDSHILPVGRLMACRLLAAYVGLVLLLATIVAVLWRQPDVRDAFARHA